MIKIQEQENEDGLVIHIEGRLAGPFVPELESCWQTARIRRPFVRIAVDLKEVTCVDRAGRALLRSMYGAGVGFIRAGMATRDILEQIMEEHECTDQIR
jgi:hypothetical protein